MRKAPKRRATDRLRELADRLWDGGQKEDADAMHAYAREQEAKREFDFCCNDMNEHINTASPDDVDCIIVRNKHNVYGIPIHDGGASYIQIHYCPWCGKYLRRREARP
jgi:hypothetical protein